MRADEARSLAESWVTHLEAERKSPHTIRTYTAGLNAYIAWCEREGLAVDLAPKPVEKFMARLTNSLFPAVPRTAQGLTMPLAAGSITVSNSRLTRP